MKQATWLQCAAVLLSASLFTSSCKKSTKDLHPTPVNTRLKAYTIQHNDHLAIGGDQAVVNENYTFYYDAQNRVSQILYTSNNAATYNTTARQSIAFTYMSDTVIKVRTDLKQNLIIETDTFLLNSNNLITKVYKPNYIGSFDYYGKLLIRQTDDYIVYGQIDISRSLEFTSYNGDFLTMQVENTLHANISTSKLDTTIVTPLSAGWADFTIPTATTATHTLKGFTDTYSPYTGHLVSLTVVDNNGIILNGFFPGGTSLNVDYSMYQDKDNRIGDYLQMTSFTEYGYNLYQNNHLVRKIANANRTTDVDYTFDSDNKINQLNVTTTDSVSNQYLSTYKLTYENY